MLIDWVTVAFQAINFLILVWLLKRFLYSRIIAAMDQREQAIAERYAEAADREKAADDRAEEYARLQEDLDQKRDRILAQAQEESDSRRKELMDQARAEADSRRQAWQEALERDRQALVEQVRGLAAREAYAAAAQAVSDLTGRSAADLQEAALERFLERLGELGPEDRDRLVQALDDSQGDLVVSSAAELGEEDQTRLTQALGQALGREAAPRFEVEPDLGLGLTLRGPGVKLAWSGADYLEELAEEADRALARAAGHTREDAAPEDAAPEEAAPEETAPGETAPEETPA